LSKGDADFLRDHQIIPIISPLPWWPLARRASGPEEPPARKSLWLGEERGCLPAGRQGCNQRFPRFLEISENENL